MSVKVFWILVIDGLIDGYLVVFCLINEERWGIVVVDCNIIILY